MAVRAVVRVRICETERVILHAYTFVVGSDGGFVLRRRKWDVFPKTKFLRCGEVPEIQIFNFHRSISVDVVVDGCVHCTTCLHGCCDLFLQKKIQRLIH